MLSVSEHGLVWKGVDDRRIHGPQVQIEQREGHFNAVLAKRVKDREVEITFQCLWVSQFFGRPYPQKENERTVAQITEDHIG